MVSTPPALVDVPLIAAGSRSPRIHLRALGVALVLLAVALAALATYSVRLQRREIDRLGFVLEGQRARGLALQRAALRRDDVMMLFGSSELVLPAPLRAPEFFQSAPTGFIAFPVGEPGTHELMTIQDLVALGPALRGKRIAVFLSLDEFSYRESPRRADSADVKRYRRNFSPLHAAATLFSTSLDPAIKRDVARRLLRMPGVLDGNALLGLVARLVADPTPVHRVAYALAYPLGRFTVAALELQDDLVVLGQLGRGLDLPPRAARVSAEPDWSRLRAQGEALAQARATSNPYGYDDRIWKTIGPARRAELAGSRPSHRVLAALRSRAGFDLFDLMVRVLKQFGAEPIFISGPYKGPWAAYLGIAPAARLAVYAAVADHAREQGVRLLTFAEYDEDRWFLIDRSHPSGKAWAVYDEVLDAFYHGRLE